MDDGKAEMEVTLDREGRGVRRPSSPRKKLAGFTVKVKKVTQGTVEVEIK